MNSTKIPAYAGMTDVTIFCGIFRFCKGFRLPYHTRQPETLVYQYPNVFHHSKPMVQKIRISTTLITKPAIHHSPMVV